MEQKLPPNILLLDDIRAYELLRIGTELYKKKKYIEAHNIFLNGAEYIENTKLVDLCIINAGKSLEMVGSYERAYEYYNDLEKTSKHTILKLKNSALCGLAQLYFCKEKYNYAKTIINAMIQLLEEYIKPTYNKIGSLKNEFTEHTFQKKPIKYGSPKRSYCTKNEFEIISTLKNNYTMLEIIDILEQKSTNDHSYDYDLTLNDLLTLGASNIYHSNDY